MTEDREDFERVYFPFVAELTRRLGSGEAAAIAAASDDYSTLVVCENGDTYRVRAAISFERVPDPRQEGEVQP